MAMPRAILGLLVTIYFKSNILIVAVAQSSNVITDGSTLTCHNPKCDLTFNDMIADISTFCSRYEGHGFATESYHEYVRDQINDNIYIIAPPSTGPLPGCNYTLDFELCYNRFEGVIDGCNKKATAQVTTLGKITGLCNWTWTIEPASAPPPKPALSKRDSVGPPLAGICTSVPGFSASHDAVAGGVQSFCASHIGMQVSKGVSAQTLTGTVNGITCVIEKPEGGPYVGCDYTVDYERCVEELWQAIKNCNDWQKDTIYEGGSVVDTACQWTWAVELGQQSAHEKRQEAGNELSCSKEYSVSTTYEQVTKGIREFCKPLNGSEISADAHQLFASTCDSVTYTIEPTGGERYATCDYKLGVDRCVDTLTAAIEGCNDFSKTTIAHSGSVIDPDCHWRWGVELTPKPYTDQQKRQQDGPLNRNIPTGYMGGGT